MSKDEQTILPETFEPTYLDVICGRDTESFHHEGNRRLRELLKENIPVYETAKTKKEKSAVVASIVDRIRREAGLGGFVRKDYESGRWMEIGAVKAREKVGHALRIEMKKRKEGGGSIDGGTATGGRRGRARRRITESSGVADEDFSSFHAYFVSSIGGEGGAIDPFSVLGEDTVLETGALLDPTGTVAFSKTTSQNKISSHGLQERQSGARTLSQSALFETPALPSSPTLSSKLAMVRHHFSEPEAPGKATSSLFTARPQTKGTHHEDGVKVVQNFFLKDTEGMPHPPDKSLPSWAITPSFGSASMTIFDDKLCDATNGYQSRQLLLNDMSERDSTNTLFMPRMLPLPDNQTVLESSVLQEQGQEHLGRYNEHLGPSRHHVAVSPRLYGAGNQSGRVLSQKGERGIVFCRGVQHGGKKNNSGADEQEQPYNDE